MMKSLNVIIWRFLFLILMLSCLAIAPNYSIAATQLEVAEFVRDSVLTGSLSGFTLWMTDMPYDTEHVAVSYDALNIDTLPYTATWVVMVDLSPDANWGHQCIWVYLNDSNLRERIFKMGKVFPPIIISEFGTGSIVYFACIDLTFLGAAPCPALQPSPSESGLTGMDKDCLYAILISGGVNDNINYGRYPDNLARMYKILRKCGYPKGNIFVYYDNGNSLDLDNLDGDNDHATGSDVTGSADEAAIRARIQYLCTILDPLEDILFIYTTNHGSPNGLCLWDFNNSGNLEPNETYTPAELGDDTKNCQVCRLFLILDQCFSGLFLDLASDGNHYNTAIYVAASATEPSWGTEYLNAWDDNDASTTNLSDMHNHVASSGLHSTPGSAEGTAGIGDWSLCNCCEVKGRQIVSERELLHCNVETANDFHITYYSDTRMTLSDHFDGPFTNFHAVPSTNGWEWECTWSGATVNYCSWISVGAEFRQESHNWLRKKDIYWTLDGTKVGNNLPIPGFSVSPAYGIGPVTMTLYNDAFVPLTITELEIGIVPSVLPLSEMEYSSGALGSIRLDPISLEPGQSWDSVLNPGMMPFSLLAQGYSSGPTGEVYFVDQHEHLSTPAIRIEKTHNTYQGQYEYVSITIENYPIEMGGFDFLIGYDASALAFAEAEPGQLLEGCDWEYFTYRYGVHGNCDNACPSGLLRIIAMAETNDGSHHPSCYGPPDTDPHELARMKFLVSNDRNYNGQYVPIYFFWDDCGDNSISSVDGEVLYIDHAIYDFEENLIWNEDDDDEFPEDERIPFVGAPDYCLNPDPDKPSAIRCVDFIHGGIDIIPSEFIDARGDVNLNGVAYEIADAVVFTNFFIYGYSAFTVNVAGQIAATEINGDGTVLTVADLVYLIRVILGNAPPIPKLTPFEGEAMVSMLVNHSASAVATNSPVEIGAAQFIIEHQGYILGEPHLINGASDMTLIYNDKDGVLKVLVYSLEAGRTIDAGPENIFIVPIDGEGSMRLREVQLADNYGSLLSGKIDADPLLPTDFVLHQNYPNPFNSETQIVYELPQTADVRIEILNTLGQNVATLIDREETAGVHRVSWNGTDFNGNSAASGIYIYRFEAAGNVVTRKMTLLK